MDRIIVRANPRCKNCLGGGIAQGVYADATMHVCACVTEQLKIITVAKKNYALPIADRYNPGPLELVME